VSIYAVNGKEPVAAWIPSLDAAGNGTTTLTDLVGSRPGTLTDMDAATDWVSDTEAGGVRALDFDGTNDKISGVPMFSSASWAVSLWLKMNATTEGSNRSIFGNLQFNTSGFLIQKRRSNAADGTQNKLIFSYAPYTPNYSLSVFPTGVWSHVCFSYDGSSYTGWINGVEQFSSVAAFVQPSSGDWTFCGRSSGLLDAFYSGRLDDARVFDEGFVLADVQYLYGGGLGRGITKSGGIIPILRQHYAAQGAR
jgi:hypothetical protein